jgi:hypothetical protein
VHADWQAQKVHAAVEQLEDFARRIALDQCRSDDRPARAGRHQVEMAENLMSILARKEIIKHLRLDQGKGTTAVQRQYTEGLSARPDFHRQGFQ